MAEFHPERYAPWADMAVVEHAAARFHGVDVPLEDLEDPNMQAFLVMSLVAGLRREWRTELAAKFMARQLDPADMCNSLSFGEEVSKVGQAAHKLFLNSLSEHN